MKLGEMNFYMHDRFSPSSSIFVSYSSGLFNQAGITISDILLVFIVFVFLPSIALFMSSSTYACSDFFASQETKRNIEITRRLQENVGPYKPPLWYNAHLGTMFPWGENPDIDYDREIFKVPSEDNRVEQFGM